MEELLKNLEMSLKDNPQYVIGRLSEILQQQEIQIGQLMEIAENFQRFQERVIAKNMPLFQEIVSEFKLEQLKKEKENETII